MQQHVLNHSSFNAIPAGTPPSNPNAQLNGTPPANGSHSKKRPRNNRKSSARKKPLHENPRAVYVNVFDQEDSRKRGEMWNKVEIQHEVGYVASETCLSADAEKSFYDECDLNVACLVKGVFADALVQIGELLQENEIAPDFKVTMGTSDSVAEAPGSVVETEPPTKEMFKWFNRIPV